MVVWKLTVEDPFKVEYFALKKELLKFIEEYVKIRWSTNEHHEPLKWKLDKIYVRDKWDLVFQLKIAQNKVNNGMMDGLL